MFSSTLRSRQPWPTIIPSLFNFHLTESAILTTTDLRLPGGISALLLTSKDDQPGALKRLDRAMQSGEGGDTTVVIFLGSGVWEFQLLDVTRLDSTFTESVYLIPLSTLQELPRVLERLLKDFKTTTTAQAASEAKDRASWTPARMLPLMTTTNTHLSSHVTLVLHSLFPSLQALAHNANEHSLEVLEDAEARGVIDFLDVEFVFGE